MRNIDELVRDSIYSSSGTFNSEREYYNKLTAKIETLLDKRNFFETCKTIAISSTGKFIFDGTNLTEINGEYKILSDEETMSFKDKLDLYNLARNQNNPQLAKKLLNQYSDLNEYINLCEELGDARRERNDILTEKISFHNFGGDEHFDECCYPRHAIIKNGDNDLVCMFCGATSKDFALNEEETEFLALCAESQGMFLKGVTKKDLPLLKLLIEEKKERRRTRTPYYEMEEDWMMDIMGWAEEEYLEDDRVVFDIELQIKRAQMLDAGILEDGHYRVGNPKYLDEEQTGKFIAEIDHQISSLKNSTSKHRDLQLEICRTYKYEVLILSGNKIPTLYNEAQTEEDKIALVKAYFNLSNDEYRIQSGYFKTDHRNNDAVFYDCYTAHPEINEKLMEMKLRR